MERKKQKHWNQDAHFSDQPMMNGGVIGQDGVPASDQDVRQFYNLGEYLGSEDRSLEFKAGAGFLNYRYHDNVAKIICAFANSQGKGKVLLGVNENGEVVGLECSHHKEDNIRCNTDEAIKDITPPIFPQRYTVRFVPVVNQKQIKHGNKKVIEICLNGPLVQKQDILYSTSKGVYQRRDGGTHVLKPNEIQEWFRQSYEGEIRKLKESEQTLRSELQSCQMKNHQLEGKLLDKTQELNQHEDQNQQMQEIQGQVQEVTAICRKLETFITVYVFILAGANIGIFLMFLYWQGQ